MIRTLLASALLVGGLALPAMADEIDYRVVGGTAYGSSVEDAGGWDGPRRGPGYDRGPGYERGPGFDRPAWDYRPDWRMSPRQVARSLRQRGFYDVEIVRVRGDVTIARAAARGLDMILVVDARSGEILRQRPANGWAAGRGWHGGWGQDWRRW